MVFLLRVIDGIFDLALGGNAVNRLRTAIKQETSAYRCESTYQAKIGKQERMTPFVRSGGLTQLEGHEN